jgi:serine/threonine-protein kinase
MAQFGGYELVEKIGEGGMAIVYKGIQGSLDRPVAIKVLSRTLTDDPQVVESFNRESLIIARLNHPNIIHVIDRGIADSVPYFVMEFVAGTHLGLVIQEGRYDIPQKVDAIIQMCKALAYAHKNGVIHLDIKPANILIDCEGNIKVADFGIAHLFSGEDLEQACAVTGTPSYMSPEQKQGIERVTMASDIYSLGVVMYELFTGRKPVIGVVPSSIDARIPRRLDEIIVGCLRTNPADRFANADLVKDALLAMSQGAHIRKEQKERAVEGFKNLTDKFGLLDVIKESRHGGIYQFENRATRQLLAIKKLVGATDGLSEAKLLARLQHPRVAGVHGTATRGRTSIIVMEYLSGGCLRDRFASIPAWQESLPLLREICEGLAFLHRNRLVHGNLRPSNILLTADGHAKIADVGFAAHYLDSESERNWYSRRDEMKSAQGDIFAAGMIFSELLAGSRPIEKRGRLAQGRGFHSLPKLLRTTLTRMISPNPAHRYASFDEILLIIDQLLVHAKEHTLVLPRANKKSTSLAARLGISRLTGAVGSIVKSALR